jgi:hypothetical protein
MPKLNNKFMICKKADTEECIQATCDHRIPHEPDTGSILSCFTTDCSIHSTAKCEPIINSETKKAYAKFAAKRLLKGDKYNEY